MPRHARRKAAYAFFGTPATSRLNLASAALPQRPHRYAIGKSKPINADENVSTKAKSRGLWSFFRLGSIAVWPNLHQQRSVLALG
jgi:hypothetical protein